MSTCATPVAKRLVHKTRDENVHLADLRHDPEQPGLFRARLICETTHPYYFEHPADHLPGMLLIEAGRQMVEATCHAFGQVPLTGNVFLWNSLSVTFTQFADLHMPVDLLLQIEETDTNQDGSWNRVQCVVSVRQWDHVASRMAFGASIVSQRSFQRLRRHRQTTRRFTMRPDARHMTSLRDGAGREYNSRLLDLSDGGFCLGLDSLPDAERADSPFLFALAFAGFTSTIVQGEARLRWQNAETRRAGFQITNIAASDQARLSESIRLCTTMREDRP